MDQQHVARQARRRGHLLLEEGEDVGRLALVEVGHVLRECHRLLEADRREAAVGLRGGLDDGALEVAAAVAGDVVPEHFDTVLRDREGVVAALLEIRQAVAVVDRLHVQRALLDRLVDLGRQGHRAMGLVHRDPVGFRVALEHRQLAVGELVLVLLDVLRGDGEQRLLVGKGIGKEALAIDLAGAGREAAGPGRMLPSALPSFCAPMGVRLLPSLAASSGETAAVTEPASGLRASAPEDRSRAVFMRRYPCSYPRKRPPRGAADLRSSPEAHREEVAVVDRVVVAAEEVGVADAGGIGVLVVGIEADADGLAPSLKFGP